MEVLPIIVFPKPHPPAPSPSEKGSKPWDLKLPSLKERGWG